MAMWIVFAACRSAPPPNVLVVTLDTTRADALGVYDPSRPSVTPRLDALAAEGIRFDRAYTVTPLTIPAHASLHTGLLPPRHQVRDNGDVVLSRDAVTLAERLNDAGWHTMAAVGAEVTSQRWGFAQGFDTFDDLRPGPDRWRIERPAEDVIAPAVRWIADQTGPWFVWVHLFDAHAPYDPPGTWTGDPYRAEIAHLDLALGPLLDAVDRENTWVLVLADHGEALGDHGEDHHGVLLYDATTRIPWIVRPPGGDGGGRVIDAPVSLVDLYPTVLSLVGVPAGDTDGFDLSRTLLGTRAPNDDRGVYVESLYGTHHHGWAPQRAWVDGTHKWIDSTTPELYTRADRAERDDQAGIDRDRGRRMKADLDAYVATLSPLFEPESASDDGALVALGYQTVDVPTPTGPLPDPVGRLAILREVEAARSRLVGGDLAGARDRLVSILDREPGLEDARLLMARVEDGLGDSEAALRTVDGLLALRVTSTALAAKGTILARRGEPELALPVLQEALALDPTDAASWNTVLGLSFGTPGFRSSLDDALSALPDDVGIGGYQGLSLAVRGEATDAIPLLRTALSAGPHPLFGFGLGLAWRSVGQDAAAEDVLTEEIRLFPPALAARRVLAGLYAEQRRYDEQLAVLAEIAALEEPSVTTGHARAQALFNLGRVDEAEVEVEACRRSAPTHAGCAMLVANVYAKLGRTEDAARAYREALALAGR